MSSRWYPIYQRGNPQLRIFLPNLWMKLVKPDVLFGKSSIPNNKVTFIVSPQMTKIDVKNYLEKIYNVPVANVKTTNIMGKTRQNAYARYLVKDDDQKFAFVTLQPGHTFEWPDLKITENEGEAKAKMDEDIKAAKDQFAADVKADDIKYRPGVPTFFGL